MKSLSGGSYAGTQNPTGVIAKVNQNAAKQGPTVIIQATGSTYVEALPLLVANSQIVPACPTGYTSAWSASYPAMPPATSGIQNRVYNIAGSRFSFGATNTNGGETYAGFFIDHMPELYLRSTSVVSPLPAPISIVQSGSTYTAIAANLCTK